MFRKDLIRILEDSPMSIAEIARRFRVPPAEIRDDLEHLLKSLAHTELRAVIAPASCLQCGFVFRETKLAKPGKCPQCKATRIQAPRVHVTRKSSRDR